MGVYDRQIETAKRLIKEKGRKITWRQFTPGSGGTVAVPASDVIVDHSDIPIVFLPASSNQLLLAYIAMMAGTEVPTGGMLGLMGAVAFTPAAKDVVVLPGGEILSIKSVDLLAPNGDPILYTIGFVR